MCPVFQIRCKIAARATQRLTRTVVQSRAACSGSVGGLSAVRRQVGKSFAEPRHAQPVDHISAQKDHTGGLSGGFDGLEQTFQIGPVAAPLAPCLGKADGGQAQVGGLDDQSVQNAKSGKDRLEVGPGIAGVQLHGVACVEQGCMHGIGALIGVADQRQRRTTLDHVGGIAVARPEIKPAGVPVTVIPACLGRVECGWRGQRQHLAPGAVTEKAQAA